MLLCNSAICYCLAPRNQGFKELGGATAKAGGAGMCEFCLCDAGQSTQSLGSEDCYFYHDSIWSIQSIIPYLTSPRNINNHLLNSTDSTYHVWTSHHFLIYDIHNTHFRPAPHHLPSPGGYGELAATPVEKIDIHHDLEHKKMFRKFFFCHFPSDSADCPGPGSESCKLSALSRKSHIYNLQHILVERLSSLKLITYDLYWV